MLNFSKLTNTIFSLFIMILLTLLVSGLLISYSTTEIVRDREIIKEEVKSEQVREAYVKYITNIIEENDDEIEGIIDEQKVEELLEEESNRDEINSKLDQLVDETYLWLEEDGDKPSVEVFENKEAENNLESELREKIGPIAGVVDYEKLEEKIPTVSLYNVSKDNVDRIPNIYQNAVNAYKKVAIGIVILTFVIFFSAKNLRTGFLYFGIILSLGAAIPLLGPQLDFGSELNSSNIIQNLNDLPWLLKTPFKSSIEALQNINMPEFVSKFFINVAKRINERIALYSKIVLAFGLSIVFLTQFSLKEIEETDRGNSLREDDTKPKPPPRYPTTELEGEEGEE
jgi:hypothetical protein